MKTLPIFILFLMMTSGIFGQEIVTDIDGNQYNTVQIGDQVWLKENLKVSRFNNGDPILTCLTPLEWWQTSHYDNPEYGTPSQGYYEGDTSLLNRYGRLYNWYVASDNRNICPTGWKVPSYMEYYEMFSFVDSTTLDLLDYNVFYINDGIMNDQSGKKFLSGQYWDQGLGGNNQTGWSGLPGGILSYSVGDLENMNVKYRGDGWYSGFWTTDTVYWDMDGVFGRRSKSIHFYGDYIRMYTSGRGLGYSIRCLKDTSSGFYEEIKVNPSIYPNPTNGNITFVSNDDYINQTYGIYDVNGKLVVSGQINSVQETINLVDQPSGVYMLRVDNDMFKIIKN
jgi:uncharacterized protein (TIGR02145 family)